MLPAAPAWFSAITKLNATGAFPSLVSQSGLASSHCLNSISAAFRWRSCAVGILLVDNIALSKLYVALTQHANRRHLKRNSLFRSTKVPSGEVAVLLMVCFFFLRIPPHVLRLGSGPMQAIVSSQHWQNIS
jgi:hypothetical protein